MLVVAVAVLQRPAGKEFELVAWTWCSSNIGPRRGERLARELEQLDRFGDPLLELRRDRGRLGGLVSRGPSALVSPLATRADEVTVGRRTAARNVPAVGFAGDVEREALETVRALILDLDGLLEAGCFECPREPVLRAIIPLPQWRPRNLREDPRPLVHAASSQARELERTRTQDPRRRAHWRASSTSR